jgi:hypothetical protein
MTRTLTAGADSKPEIRPKYLPEQFQGEVEQMVWSCVLDLWRLGRQHRETAPRVAKLDQWLNRAMAWLNANPQHPDAEERRRLYGERLTRHRDLSAELEAIERHAERLKESLVKHWDRLRPQRQAALRKEPGWSKAQSGVRVAGEMWRSAKEGGVWPGGEPPFGLIGFLVMIGGLIYG